MVLIQDINYLKRKHRICPQKSAILLHNEALSTFYLPSVSCSMRKSVKKNSKYRGVSPPNKILKENRKRSVLPSVTIKSIKYI